MVPSVLSDVMDPLLTMNPSATPVLVGLPIRTPSPAAEVPEEALPRPAIVPSLVSEKVLAPSAAEPISAPKPEPVLPAPASTVPPVWLLNVKLSAVPSA